MGGIDFSVHPLFFIVGFFYAVTGRIAEFSVYTVSALLHEISHGITANKLGYKLDKILLMPFGALAKGEVEGLNFSDEIKISLSGPLFNIAIGIFTVALWWIFPVTYAYTDIVAEANFSLAIINLLPVFPLDGGRVLSAILLRAFGEKKRDVSMKIISVSFACFLMGLFVLSLFYVCNLSFLFFSLFVLFGSFGSGKNNKYVKFYTGAGNNSLVKGLKFNTFAVDVKTPVKRIAQLLNEKEYNEVIVFDKGEKVCVLSQNQLNDLMLNSDYNCKVGEKLGRKPQYISKKH